MGDDAQGRARKRSSPKWLWSVAVLFVVAYVALVALYSMVGIGKVSSTIAQREPEGGAAVYVTLSGVDSVGQRITADIGLETWAPDGSTSYVLPDTVEVLVSPLAGEQAVVFPGRTTFGTKAVQISSSGEVAYWPFDRQVTRMVFIGCAKKCVVADDATPTIVPLDVVVDGRVNGWEVKASTTKGDAPDDARVVEIVASRSLSTIFFAAVLLAVLVANTVIATVMTVRMLRRRWKFEPAFAGWMAGMLFAIVPLRGFLPRSPPIGSWIDYLVVLWVVSALVMNMIVYVIYGTRMKPIEQG